MPPDSILPNVTSIYVHEIGALLFGMVFFFLYRQSRIVYFGLWAAAWVVRLFAAFFGYKLLSSGDAAWLAPYATFEFAFVILLIAAARAGFASDMRGWRSVLRLIVLLPIFVASAWAAGRTVGMAAYHFSYVIVLGFVYFYNFITLRRHAGMGSRIFRFSLLVLAFAFVEHAGLLVYLYTSGKRAVWTGYLYQETYIEFALHCVLAFSAMAMWSESQIDRIRELGAELDYLRRETKQRLDLDRLTGLFNQAALARRIEEGSAFAGVVAVCDMDNFKEVNDHYGHLVGDEILRNIGNLLRASIRHEDEAFRWGGDEFVVLFQNQQAEVARKRMAEIEARLRDFRVRGFGSLPITFSWGTAEAAGRPLRDTLDEADRNMYAFKRARPREGPGVR